MISGAWIHPVADLAVLAAIFTYLYIDQRRRYAALWALAWSALLVEAALQLVGGAVEGEALVLAGAGAALAAGAAALCAERGRAPSGGLIGVAVGVLFLALLAVARGLDPVTSLLMHVGLALLAATAIVAGFLVARAAPPDGPLGSAVLPTVVGTVLALWGLIQVLVPLAARGAAPDWVAEADITFGAAMALGLVILGLEEARAAVAAVRIDPRRLLEDDPNMVLVVVDGRVAFANRTLVRRLATSLESLLGSDPFDYVAPDDRATARERYAERMLGQSVVDYETEVVTATGERVPVLVHADHIEWNGRRAFKYELTDITTRRRAEEDLRAVNLELQRINAELAKSNQLKTEFLSNTSHELKTPLTSIIANSEILEYEMCGPLNAEQRRVLGVVTSNSQRLLEMISRLLDFSRHEEGYDVPRWERVDVGSVLAGIAETVRPLLDERGLTIDVSMGPDVGPLWVDGEKIYRVFLNLIDNAIKFSHRGVVRVEVRRDEDWLEARVSDEGIGIAEERLDDIFDAFRQVDASTTRPYPGVGLGLAICRQVIELHGGRIWAESAPGRGSTFRFRLPYRELSPEQDRSALDQGDGAAGT